MENKRLFTEMNSLVDEVRYDNKPILIRTIHLGVDLGAIAEYPAQRVVFDSTATVVRGPQSVSKVKCMCQVLN